MRCCNFLSSDQVRSLKDKTRVPTHLSFRNPSSEHTWGNYLLDFRLANLNVFVFHPKIEPFFRKSVTSRFKRSAVRRHCVERRTTLWLMSSFQRSLHWETTLVIAGIELWRRISVCTLWHPFNPSNDTESGVSVKRCVLIFPDQRGSHALNPSPILQWERSMWVLNFGCL